MFICLIGWPHDYFSLLDSKTIICQMSDSTFPVTQCCSATVPRPTRHEYLETLLWTP